MSEKMVPHSRPTIRSICLCVVGVLVLLYLWLSFETTAFKAFHHSKSNTPSDDTPIASDTVAAIIETRPLDQIVPLLLHFSSVLGPSWPIVLFTTAGSVVTLSAPMRQLIDEHRIIIRYLPPTVDFSNRLDVSGFLTKAWVWEQLAPATHVLIFQADSILCSNSQLKVDDFLEYDFVGAPIGPAYGEGYNGGLSLRNRSMVLDIIRLFDWEDEFNKAENKQLQSVEFEDQWLYAKMKKLSSLGLPAAKLPSLEVAKTFAVETVWYEEPFGYHQVMRWQADHIEQIDRWCPENKLATSKIIG